MIRYKGFSGFFIMKKDELGEWEYMTSYSTRNGVVYDKFSREGNARYFTDNSIVNGTAFKAFDGLIRKYRHSKIVLYVKIDGKIERVKYYNPESESKNKLTVWHELEDFNCFIPRLETFRSY